jgi:hypothetical protein
MTDSQEVMTASGWNLEKEERRGRSNASKVLGYTECRRQKVSRNHEGKGGGLGHPISMLKA